MRLSKSLAAGSFCALAALTSSPAQAAAPGAWSVGIERVFGFSRATTKTETNGNTTSVTSSQVSLFDHTVSDQVGYPGARVALDYLFPSGVTVGGAIGYQSVDPDNDVNDDSVNAWLLEPRVGYFASVTASFGVWPRGGLTFLSIDTGGDDGPSYTAISVEVPLELRLGGNVCFAVMPYVDLGVGGGTDNVDQKVTELGLQFGINAFF